MTLDDSSTTPPESRFVPVDTATLLRDLCGAPGLAPDERAARERVLRLHGALFDHRLMAELRALKSCYLPFNPDLEIAPPQPPPAADRLRMRHDFHQRVAGLLQAANFEELSETDFNQALDRTSPRGVRVSVDFEDYEDVAVYYRGVETRSSQRRSGRHLYLKQVAVPFQIYRRLFLLIKLRSEAEAEAETPILLKLFRDVPRSDLEMLLPNTRVRMTAFDKLKLGVTGGGGTVGGIVATVGKLGAAANPVTWVLAIAGFAAILWRQVSKVFIQRTRYMAALAEQLYFHNLDTNFGAVAQLVETAGEEEWKEAALAWHFLLEAGAEGLSESALDARVEAHLADRYGVRVDFDVRDGVRKLRADRLVETGAGGCLVAVRPEESFRRLDETWDALFGSPQPA